MLPPSPAAYVGHLHTAASFVQCAEVERYRAYDCKTLIVHKHGHECKTYTVVWQGRWVVTKVKPDSCPHPVLREGGSLFALHV